jgi:hypothetical protein
MVATSLDRSLAPSTLDRARPVVVLVLSFAQWLVTAIVATRVQFAAGDGPPSPVQPAEYAFAIWFPIFVLGSVFGVWQALPANRESEVARRIGWPMAGAFASMAGWSIVVSLRLEWLSQILLLAGWALLVVAYLRIVAANWMRPLSTRERWVVALPVAPFLGWVTAANAVSLHSQLVRYGGLPAVGNVSLAVGGALLVVALAAGLWLLRAGRTAPVQLWGAFGLTLIWALAAIVVEQRTAAPVIAGIAGAGIVAVAAVAAIGGGHAGSQRSPAAAA